MSSQLRFPTLQPTALLWLRDIPRWRIQGYRVHCSHSPLASLRPRRSQNSLVEWHTTRESAAKALAWHDTAGGWECRYISTVLISEEETLS